MLLLLYAVIFGEMVVIVTFLFKTPLRKLVIIVLNRMKQGQGPVVVKTVAATLVVMLASALYNIFKIRRRTLEVGRVLDPTDQVLVSNLTLQASLLGFLLFLSLMIDRLHHYIRELRLLRKAVESARKQSRSFEDSKKGNAVEHMALKEEIGALKSKLRKLESECQVNGSRAKAFEADVVALKKQSEGFLIEYDRLLAENQNLRNQLEGI